MSKHLKRDSEGEIKAPRRYRMNEPFISDKTHQYCTEVLTAGWISVEGAKVKQLEKGMAELCGAVGGVAVQSGTAALWGALKALGVRDASDVVVCPAFTCAASSDAVVQAGGTPLMVDVEDETFAMSIDQVRAALDHAEWGPRVKGVVLVPCYGVPARDTLAIRELCTARGVWMVEDIAESYGATTKDGKGREIPLGSLGEMAAMSIRSEKMVGCGEGGIILSKDAKLVDLARWWCSRAPTRGVGPWRVYEHDEVGMNYRLPELLGAVALAGLENLPTMIDKKRQLHAWYEAELGPALATLPGARLQRVMPGDASVWWLNALMLPSGLSAERLGATLKKSAPNIETRPGFYPLHLSKPFRDAALPCPVTEELYNRLICLPSSHLLDHDAIGEICSAVTEGLRAMNEATLSPP